jgi:hypothetical protein
MTGEPEPMTFAGYCAAAARTRLPSTLEPPGVYPALLYASEVGELLFAIESLLSGEHESADEGLEEAGDCCWSLAMWASDRGCELATPDWPLPNVTVYPDVMSCLLTLVRFQRTINGHEQRVTRDGVDGAPTLQKPVLGLTSCFWAISALAHHLGVDLQIVLRRNLAKLAARAERGTIGGAGDDR